MFPRPVLLSVCFIILAHMCTSQISTEEQENTEEINSLDAEVNGTMAGNATVTSIPIFRSPSRQLHYMRERSRHFRLLAIRQQVMRSLGWRVPPKINKSALVLRNIFQGYDFMQDRNEPVQIEEHICYSASCHLPNSVDENLWQSLDPRVLRLYMGVQRFSNNDNELVSAQIKLFMTHMEGCPCNMDGSDSSGNSGPSLFFKVYQFRRPLNIRRRGRIINRKRLIETKTVTYQEYSWITLNVFDAVNSWVRGNRRNFGFEIVVKDENETTIDARSLFVPVDCNSPSDIGCREDTNSVEPQFPSNLDIWANYPYLEVVSRSTQERMRSRREVVSRRLKVAATQCRGTRITKVTAPWVLSPSTYETLDCHGVCDKCPEDSTKSCSGKSGCRPARKERVKGFVLGNSTEAVFGVLPYERVTLCRCDCDC